jgi:hypothetical protein
MDKTLWAVSLVFCGAASAQPQVIVVVPPGPVPPGYCSPDWPKLPGPSICDKGAGAVEAAKPPPPARKPVPRPVEKPKPLITV